MLTLATFGLSGCGGTPACGDNETKALVIDIAKDELIKQGMSEIMPKLKFSVDNIRTSSHDKSVDKYECAADFKMIGDKTETISITYTSQNTDDGDNFYVEVNGFKKIIIKEIMK